MLESVNIRSNVAVFVQIENEIRFAVASGTLKAGDKLPPVKALGQRLGLNFNTVQKSYRDLEVMGVIYTRRGLGSFIATGAQAICHKQCRLEFAGRLHEVVAEAKAVGMKRKELRDIAKASYASKAGPYDEVPARLLKQA